MSSQLSPKLIILACLILTIMLILAGALVVLSRPEPTIISIHPPRPTATPAPTATQLPILVYVTGAVNQGETTYTLPYGSRVSDALAAAGGLTEHADRSLVNLAGRLRDGDHVHVPALGELGGDLPTPSGGQIIFINSATQEELESLPGIGAVTARRIIEYRELAGEFRNLNDLDNVAGIGEAMLEKLKDLIAFD